MRGNILCFALAVLLGLAGSYLTFSPEQDAALDGATVGEEEATASDIGDGSLSTDLVFNEDQGLVMTWPDADSISFSRNIFLPNNDNLVNMTPTIVTLQNNRDVVFCATGLRMVPAYDAAGEIESVKCEEVAR